MADFSLDGKVAMVTGGNSGIGRAIALGFAEHGARVAIAARDKDRNAAVGAELGDAGRAYEADVGDGDRVVALVGEVVSDFGRLDILVNNAGMARGGPVTSLDVDVWRRVLDVNLTSALIASRELARAAERGKIINILSEYATFGAGFLASYTASKHALHGLTKSLAIELAPRIQVNGIQPGWIDTPMTAGAKAAPAFNEEILRRTPAGRWGEPSDCVGAAVFLASPASDFVTGIMLPVDGGYRVR
jgi:2-deoxy-D-gluconate 3-dehydrogenase